MKERGSGPGRDLSWPTVGKSLRRAYTIHTATLRDELLAFRPKATQKPDDLEGWLEGKDDDLVLAVATSVWTAERFLRKKDAVPVGVLGYPGAATG